MEKGEGKDDAYNTEMQKMEESKFFVVSAKKIK